MPPMNLSFELWLKLNLECTWVQSPALTESGVLVCACHLSTQEVEAGKLGHAELHSELKASLGYV